MDDAARQHHARVAQHWFAEESCHALFEIYSRARELDRAYCVASTLCFLLKATPAERRFVEQHRPRDFVLASTRLTEDVLRRHISHPDQDLYVSGCLGLIAPAVAAWRAVELPSSIPKQERIDIMLDPSLMSRMCKYVNDVLHVATPDLYLRPREPGDLIWLNVRRDGRVHPSLVVFRSLLAGKSERDLAFALGRALLELYPPYYCIVAVDRSHVALRQVFRACQRAMGLPVEGDEEALDVIAREVMGRMRPDAIEQLRSLIHRCSAADFRGWMASVEATTSRVGLLLCGDVRSAAVVISQEQAKLDSLMSPRDKIRELVLYSISEDYFAARKAVGLQIRA